MNDLELEEKYLYDTLEQYVTMIAKDLSPEELHRAAQKTLNIASSVRDKYGNMIQVHQRVRKM